MKNRIENYTAALYQQIRLRAKKKRLLADFNGQKMSYLKLLNSIKKLTAFFNGNAVKSGSRIIIITRHDEHAITIPTTAILGGIAPVTLSSDVKTDRAKAIVQKVSPAMIFIDNDKESAWPWLSEYNTVFINEQQSAASPLPRLFRRTAVDNSFYPEILADCKPEEPTCNANAEDIAFISFSSGTTSSPKGILLSHANLFEHLGTIIRTFDYNSDAKIFNNLSLAHVDGFVQGPMLTLCSGALLFRPQPFSINNLESLLNQVYRKRITHFITVPTIISLMDRLLTNDDYFTGDDFICMVSVAAKLDKKLWERSQEQFNIKICNMYGLTETVTGGLFCGPGTDHFSVGTVGKPIDIQAKIINDQGSICATDETGELLLKGANVTPGYLDDPAATADLFDEDWLRTGDMAKQRADGFFEIVGRKKSIIVSGGFNIHPDEIDEVLVIHPKINASVTVGIEDRDWGELAVTAVETTMLIDETELINHCRHYLETIKVPKNIICVDKLPRGISGKVILSETRELILSAIAATTLNEAKINDNDIVELTASVFNLPPDTLSLKSTAEHIQAWDSLGHLSLITAVEQKFDIQFGVDDMMRVNSLQVLRDLVAEKLA